MRLHYEGILTAPRRSPEQTRSKYHTPAFTDESDFAGFEKIGRQVWTAALVNYEEKYVLLAQIVAAVRRHLGDGMGEIVLNSRMPSALRMPRELFGADIFLVHDVAAEARSLLADVHSFVTVHEGFVRDYIEAGSNELLLDWYKPSRDGVARLQALADEFITLGLATCRITELQEGA
jgi:hypothetical protein